MATLRRFVRSLIVPALGSGILLLSAGMAGAQQPNEFPSWEITGWSFTPSVTFGTFYDSNVALVPALASTGTTQGDTVWSAAPSADLEYRGRRTTFASGYRGSWRRYFDLDALDGFDQQAHMSLVYRATKQLTVHLRDSYLLVPTTDELELDGLPFLRTGSRSNVFSGGFESRLSRLTTLSMDYDLSSTHFDRPSDTLLAGGNIHSVRTLLDRRLGSRLTAGAESNLRLADLSGGGHPVIFHDVGAHVVYAFGAHTTLDGAAGVSVLVDRNESVTRTGPFIHLGITERAERMTYGASYDRAFVPSFGFGGSNRNQEARGFVQRPFTRSRLYVQGSAGWRRSDPFLANEVELNTYWLRPTVGYSVARWMRTEVYYAFTRQDTQFPGANVRRHRVGVEVIVSQPVRIR